MEMDSQMSTMQMRTASTIWRDTLNRGSHQPAVKSGGPAGGEELEGRGEELGRGGGRGSWGKRLTCWGAGTGWSWAGGLGKARAWRVQAK